MMPSGFHTLSVEQCFTVKPKMKSFNQNVFRIISQIMSSQLQRGNSPGIIFDLNSEMPTQEVRKHTNLKNM